MKDKIKLKIIEGVKNNIFDGSTCIVCGNIKKEIYKNHIICGHFGIKFKRHRYK